MNDIGTHPSPEQLAAFGHGRLSEADEAGVETHLAGCPECRARLEVLPEDAFLNQLRRAARPDPAALTPNADLAEAPTSTGPTAPEVEARSPDRASTATEVPPELVQHPRYRILEVLGAGGMGVVYKAEHLLMERPVALKVISRQLVGDPLAVERFRREVRSAARLAHPNIVTAYDAEQAGDTHFLVMEFVEGVSLDKLVAQQGRLPIDRACDYVRQAALGLQHAFECGMVHRDIKPGNLMRTPAGRIKILDFGLARFARESAPAALPTPEKIALAAGAGPASATLTQEGAVMGTPDYIAPEQAASLHVVDIRADIYSLGCTLYFLLTGRVVFPRGTGVDKILAHAEQRPQPLTELRPEVPLELARVVERMLAKDPAQRYQTPAEVAVALEPFTRPAAPPAALPKPAAPEPAEEPSAATGRWKAWAAAAAGGGALLIILLLLAREGREEAVTESMETIYTVCAVVGGTLLVCQFLMSVLGFGHHDVGGHDFHADLGGHDLHPGESHEAGHDAHSSWFAGLLTFRTVVAALTFFGLAGRAGMAGGMEPARTFILALAAAAGALFLVAWMMRALYFLKSDGTLRVHRAVGQIGTVYLPIPGRREGVGKVMLNLQNRTVEFQAVTAQAPLPTGAKVQVVALVSSDTVEVVSAPTSEGIKHV